MSQHGVLLVLVALSRGSCCRVALAEAVRLGVRDLLVARSQARDSARQALVLVAVVGRSSVVDLPPARPLRIGVSSEHSFEIDSVHNSAVGVRALLRDAAVVPRVDLGREAAAGVRSVAPGSGRLERKVRDVQHRAYIQGSGVAAEPVLLHARAGLRLLPRLSDAAAAASGVVCLQARPSSPLRSSAAGAIMVEQAPAVAASASASRGEQQLQQQQWQQHRLRHSPAWRENAFEVPVPGLHFGPSVVVH